jgi:hypothetical protein
MEGRPLHVDQLPPFTNQQARCARCGAGSPIRVHYDRPCSEVVGGPHYHRICRCGHRWSERAGAGSAVTAAESTRAAPGSRPA